MEKYTTQSSVQKEKETEEEKKITISADAYAIVEAINNLASRMK